MSFDVRIKSIFRVIPLSEEATPSPDVGQKVDRIVKESIVSIDGQTFADVIKTIDPAAKFDIEIIPTSYQIVDAQTAPDRLELVTRISEVFTKGLIYDAQNGHSKVGKDARAFLKTEAENLRNPPNRFASFGVMTLYRDYQMRIDVLCNRLNENPLSQALALGMAPHLEVFSLGDLTALSRVNHRFSAMIAKHLPQVHEEFGLTNEQVRSVKNLFKERPWIVKHDKYITNVRESLRNLVALSPEEFFEEVKRTAAGPVEALTILINVLQKHPKTLSDSNSIFTFLDEFVKKHKPAGAEYENLMVLCLLLGVDKNALLHFNAVQGNDSLVQNLIEIGSNPNATINEKSALRAAVEKGHLNVVQVLLNHGVELTEQDIDAAPTIEMAKLLGRYSLARFNALRNEIATKATAELAEMDFHSLLHHAFSRVNIQ